MAADGLIPSSGSLIDDTTYIALKLISYSLPLLEHVGLSLAWAFPITTN